MEILYLYIDDIGRTFKNQEICFSNDYDIQFKEGNLKLKKKYNPFTNFWGEKVSNINLLIGKNGTGKTTILDLLGMPRSERKKSHNSYKLSWFVLYKDRDNKFIIEGNNMDLINNIINKDDSMDFIEYSIVVNYGDNDVFEIESFIQDDRNDTKLAYLYYTNYNLYEWYNKSDNDDYSDDEAFSFIRSRVDVPDYDNIYNFIWNEIKFLDSNYTNPVLDAPNLECNIGIRTFQNSGNIHFWDKDKKYNTKQEFIITFICSLIYNGKHFHDSIEKSYEEEKAKLIQIYEQQRFNIKNEIKEILILLEELDEQYFSRETYQKIPSYCLHNMCISIKIQDKYNDTIYKLLNKIKNPKLGGNFNITFNNLSTGEIEFINVYSNIYTGIKKNVCNEYSLVNKLGGGNKDILILLDEPDRGFHPEWSRRFISYLCNMSNYIADKYCCNIQYIITTHSPFLVSDIPKNNIHCLQKKDGSNLCIIRKSTMGFMSNIHDILKKDFVIDAPIGYFAEKKFEEIQKRISEIRDIEEDKELIKTIKYIIYDIDEKILAFELGKIFKDHIDKLAYKDPKQRQLRIKQLEEEIKRLKNGDEND